MTTVLPGAVVRGSDDQIVGRVRDIYLTDRTGELAGITVSFGQLSPRLVLIPAAAIISPEAEATDEGAPDGTGGGDGAADEPAGGAEEPPHVQDAPVRLRVDSMTVRAGITAPDTGHATPEQLHLAARELGIEEAAAG